MTSSAAPAPLLYIHGFASVGLGQKSLQLKAMLQRDILCPDLIHHPYQDLQTLSQLIEQHKIDTVIGSSLGGFYALLLGLRYQLKLLLINPALRSPETLQHAIGTVTRYNGEDFVWSQQQIDELIQLSQQIQPPFIQRLDAKKVCVLLAEQDEILDYRVALQLLAGTQIVLDSQQDHRFADLKPYQSLIENFIANP